MTINYITENNCERYGVTFQNNGYVKLQKFEDFSNDENSFYHVKPLRIILGKSQVYNMNMFSGGLNKPAFDGNAILLEKIEENGMHENVCIGGDMVSSFMTSDKLYEYISKMGNTLCPYTVATSEENYYLTAPNLNFIRKGKIDYDATLEGMYPCEGESFKELELCKIHSNYD